MAGGNATIFENLKESLGSRSDFRSAWLPVAIENPNGHGPAALRNGRVTARKIREFEEAASRFDAAYFFQHTMVTALFAFRKRVPYILAMDGTPMWYNREGLQYAHDPFDPRRPASRIKRRIIASVYRGAHHLLPLSEGVKASLIDDYGVDPGRISVMPPAINLNDWVCPDRRATSDGPVRVLFVGGDFIRKGGDMLASVARMSDFSGVEFHFVTWDYSGDTADNIFVHSHVKRNTEELRDLYRRADIFVLPTRADSHSIVSLEAMAMGLPVLAAKVGGIADIIVEGKTGYFLTPDNRGGLIDRLQTLIRDPDERLRMGMNGRRRVEERFNLAKTSQRVAELLTEAANSKPHHR